MHRDSNNSVHYENSYEGNDVLSKLIEKNSYSNLIPYSGNECFKIRHARGVRVRRFVSDAHSLGTA